MKIQSRIFGTLNDGREVRLYTMTNVAGSSVSVMDYGARIQAIRIRDKNGVFTDCCLGYNSPEEYQADDAYMGALVGRVCNRVGGAAFSLGGKTYTLSANEGKNQLHGGFSGFDKKIFDLTDVSDDTLCFHCLSPDGEEGYPGNLHVWASFRLDDENRLTLTCRAVSDQDTLVNLTNHSYFNLSGEGSPTVLDHVLRIDSDYVTENGPGTLPTGRRLKVSGTPFDFRMGKAIGQDIDREDAQLQLVKGYDINYCLNRSEKAAVSLCSPVSGIRLDMTTDLPGLQLYTANFLDGRKGKAGIPYGPRSAVAIEPQFWPDAMSHPDFPKPVLLAGQTWESVTTYRFSLI